MSKEQEPPDWTTWNRLSSRDSNTQDLLRVSLSAAVPLRIIDLYEQGGPDVTAIEEARAFGKQLAAKGDLLLYRSRREGETAALFNGLAQALAVLSFLPGGVPPLFGGDAFDARIILAGFFGKETAERYCRQVTERSSQEVPQIWASCFRPGEEEMPHVFEITTHVEALSLHDLEQLRQEQYTNLIRGAIGGPFVLVERIASRLLLAVARSDEVVARMIHEAVTHQRPFPICRLNEHQVEAWITVRRPTLRH
jgi:hypothetical protein